MRRIKIESQLHLFADNFSMQLFSTRRNTGNNAFTFPIDLITRLKLKYHSSPREYDFLLFLEYNYFDILKCTPSIQEKLIEYVDSVYSNLFFENNKATFFSDEVVNALRYDALREKEGLAMIDFIGTKTCIYCNAQLAVVVTKEKERKARLELDHFFPKSRYPYLCTSFFNLLPVCSNCNKSKSNEKVSLKTHFHLYTETDELEQFHFNLNETGLINYFLEKDFKHLIVEFNDGKNASVEIAEKHNSLFAIKGVYETQKDIVEELVYKAEAYSKAKKRDLIMFKQLFPNKAIIDRILIGNYVNNVDIHKRPLAKFTQDIAKQLGLLPEN
ncbi:HNH endonuclease domain-containing protein [uncultured Fluviicola sp.]|uniref:HNH endonuclease domain-containing protein n=1 Tax=uncultured Fluviicola sp. TaxID=463303 RepID=UPI0025D021BE|nr:HNH endonuclease domain-containing protein [uncultured Fluviicola sp.]